MGGKHWLMVRLAGPLKGKNVLTVIEVLAVSALLIAAALSAIVAISGSRVKATALLIVPLLAATLVVWFSTSDESWRLTAVFGSIAAIAVLLVPRKSMYRPRHFEGSRRVSRK